MSTLLEMRIEELEEQNAALAAQNAELARLLSAAEKQTAELTLIALGELSLNRVRADSGRAGFIAGSEQTASYITSEIGYAVPLLEARANQYHASILAGKE